MADTGGRPSGKAATSTAAATTKSLSAVRRKEAKRVRNQESATVSMLTKFLGDDGGTKKKQKRSRKVNLSLSPPAGAAASASAAGGGDGAGRSASSFRAAKRAGGGNRSGTKSVTCGGDGGGAWSDIVNNAAANAAANSGGQSSNPFGTSISTAASRSVGGGLPSRALSGGHSTRQYSGDTVMSKRGGGSNAAALEAARSLRLAKKKKAVAKAAMVSAKAASASASTGGRSSSVQLSSSRGIGPKIPLQPPRRSAMPIPPSQQRQHQQQISGKTGRTPSTTSSSANKETAAAPVKLGINLSSSTFGKRSARRPRGAAPTKPRAADAMMDDASNGIPLSGGVSSTSGRFDVPMDIIGDAKNSSLATDIGGIDIVPDPSSKTAVATKKHDFPSVLPPPQSNHSDMTTSTAAAAAAADVSGTSKYGTYRRHDTSRTTNEYVTSTYTAKATASATTSRTTASKKRPANNDNFVRQNLRNSAGSCRGAKNKGKKKRSWGGGSGRYDYAQGGSFQTQDGASNGSDGGEDSNKDNEWKGRRKEKGGVRLVQNSSAGIDPLDDYLDGTYVAKSADTKQRGKTTSSKKPTTTTKGGVPSAVEAQASETKARSEQIPRCTRHQRQCKLLTVKKSNTGNKGRKFYVCGLPRGEQCDFFQWEDDTVQSIQRALLQSSSKSGFVARQVAAYVDRFKAFTLPELRDEAKRLGLRHVGKKGQILARLNIYVRDEVAKAVKDEKMQVGKVTGDGDDSKLDKENQSKSDAVDLLPSYCSNVDESRTIDGVEDNASDSKDESSSSNDSSISEDDELELVGDGPDEPDDLSDFEEDAQGDDESTGSADDTESDPIHKALHKYFGYREFRQGQEWAIRRVLAQERSLLVAPTGLGKSLCYALPATQMEGVCLVVSPLISLMQDQLRHLPPNIPAATLSGNLSSTQVAMTVDDLMKNRIKILFVSPERLASAAFRRLLRPKYNIEKRQYERQFPTVSLLCLDEAHCLSQWGHNFRPSYLRIRSLLPLLEPKSILALTATAGTMVVRDICHTLNIPTTNTSSFGSQHIRDDGVKALNCNRDNIDVATMILDNEDNRRSLLYKILKDDKQKPSFGERQETNSSLNSLSKGAVQPGCLSSGSVIVYVWRQRDAETVTEQLIGAGVQGGVVCYHGGMGAGERAKAQGKFMRGKARVCVATVAFGLGINKADVRGVIHLCLPPSLEHYLQEIGRAGRNGKPARAIALVLDDEVRIRSSLSHSDCIARSQIEKLCLVMRDLVDNAVLDTLPADESNGCEAGSITSLPRVAPVQSIDIALPLWSTIDAIDCKEAMIETMLSLLEENTEAVNALLSVEGNLTDEVIVTLKRKSLDKLCAHEAIARSIAKCSKRLDEEDKEATDTGDMALNPLEERLKNEGGTALQKGFLAYSLGTYKFSILRCARYLGPRAEPRHVFAALRRLQSAGELELALDRTEKGKSLHLRLNMEGIACFRSPNEQASRILGDSLEAVVDRLSSHCAQQVDTGTAKVAKMHQVIHRVTAADNQGDDDADADSNDDASTNTSSTEPRKSSRHVLFQKLTQEYFENEGKDDMPSSIDDNAASCNVPEIAKEVTASSDPREYSQLVSDTLSLMRDPTLRQRKPYPTAVNITDVDCIDYATCCLTKILHGIDSTRAPMSEWRRHPLFGKWRHCTFSSVFKSVDSIIRRVVRLEDTYDAVKWL